MTLQNPLARFKEDCDSTNLEGIFSGETLITVVAREGLDSKMDSLVALQVVVPVEALRALVAFERPVLICCRRLSGFQHSVRASGRRC